MTKSQNSAKIRFVLTGSRTHKGAIELGALAGYTNGLDRALRAVVQLRRGMPATKPGPPDKETRFEAGLRLVDVEDGSAVLVFETEEARLFEGGDQAVKELLDSIEGPAPIHGSIVEALEDARKSLGQDGRMEIRTPWRPPVAIDETLLRQLPVTFEEVSVSRMVISGWLHAADLAPDQLVIRDAEGVEWTATTQTEWNRAFSR